MVDAYLLTKAGRDVLFAKIEKLRHEKILNSHDIERARALGDLSENAEYHAAKERQSQIYAMLGDLENKLGRAQIVETANLPTDRVRFGSAVTVRDAEKDVEHSWHIVGEDEADSEHGRISYLSPVARALLGKQEGDEVEVKTPKGVRVYEILKIGAGS